MTTPQRPVRTRFAPSPTGYLHVGGARTALFSYLLAKRFGGEFVLRIEDTDTARNSQEAVEAIFEGLEWLGLTWDEGPGKEKDGEVYFQSQRKAIYHNVADMLMMHGQAYKCYMTSEELAAIREVAAEHKQNFKVTREVSESKTKHLTPEQKLTMPYVVRLDASRPEIPEVIRFTDLVHGEMAFKKADAVDDFVLIKTDGMATYNFACACDDALMNITHVLRGDDHLANTPKQLAVYHAMGWQQPRFGHIPMILGSDRQKLSKRHGATSVTMYRDAGYLPEAMVNYLARLGWSHGDQEIFSLDELVAAFDTPALNASAAVFDTKKLDWLNAHYLKALGSDDLLSLAAPRLTAEQLGSRKPTEIKAIFELLQPRATTLTDLAKQIGYFLPGPVSIDEKAKEKHLTPEGCTRVRSLARTLGNLESWDAASLERETTRWVEAQGLKLGQVAQAVRVAVTGGTASPGLFETLALVGRDTSLARLNAACREAATA